MKNNDNIKISAIRRSFIKFYDDDKEIVFYFSPITGKEWVTLDGEVVSEARKYKLISVHEFKEGEDHYLLELDTASLLYQASIECSLFKNQVMLNKYKLWYGSTEDTTSAWVTGLSVIALILVCLYIYTLELVPNWMLIVFGALAAMQIFRESAGTWLHEFESGDQVSKAF